MASFSLKIKRLCIGNFVHHSEGENEIESGSKPGSPGSHV
jgi:hypothetical protein